MGTGRTALKYAAYLIGTYLLVANSAGATKLAGQTFGGAQGVIKSLQGR